MRSRKFNPFTPGTGHTPPLLAGREDETDTLTQMINRLKGPRTWRERKLKKPPSSPIRIVGPRGVGKTALLNWAEAQAQKKKIHTVRCAYLDDDNGTDQPMRHLLEAMSESSPKLRERMRKLSQELPIAGGSSYGALVGGIIAKDPLLLLLDEVHHYSLRSLTQLLQINQQLMAQNYPLGVVMAGTPGLDSHLNKTKSTFIVRSKSLCVHALSDQAARDALQVPLEKDGVAVAPDALEAMVSETDNHPYFIQLIGAAAWNAMTKASRKDVDAELAAQAESQASSKRLQIYVKAYRRIIRSGLLEQASQVMEILEKNGGEAKEKTVIQTLIQANPGTDERRARQICSMLREDAFIWTVDGDMKPGIPSFFSYFKEKRRKLEQPCPIS